MKNRFIRPLVNGYLSIYAVIIPRSPFWKQNVFEGIKDEAELSIICNFPSITVEKS